MRQVISIHIGQGGIQVGSACWQLFCLEHGIKPDGKVSENYTKDSKSQNSVSSFFSETKDGKHIPRSVFVDLEPAVIDQMRIGPFRQLFDHQQLLSGKQDASNNYARGYFTLGKQFIDVCLERIRKLTDQCTQLQGFMVYQAVGGGTGSGFGSLLLERLSADYQKKTKIGFSVYPSPSLSNTVVEPYNSVLATHSFLSYLDADVVLHNQAIYHICRNNLDIERPSHINLNRVIAKTISSITCSLRFGGSLNQNLVDFQTNLVPYPRIHFLMSSYAPFIPADKIHLEKISVGEMTYSAFLSSNVLVKCEPADGKYMACSLMYRGNIMPKDISAAIATIKTKKTIRFVDWCPTGFKVGINYQPIPPDPGSFQTPNTSRCVSTLSNTTAISEVFSRFNYEFDLMYAKRAFGWRRNYSMKPGRISQTALEMDYEQVNKDQEEYAQAVEEG